MIFDPVFVTGSILCLYEAFLSHAPENEKMEFEKEFQFYFNKIFLDK